MNAAPTPIRPVINITHKAPGSAPVKFARVVFPEGFSMDQIRTTLDRFPEALGFRCSLRQVGPLGFSVPLELAN